MWERCLNIIKADISEQSFKTWFEPIQPLKLENDVLTVEVPSPFFYEWLEEYYVHLLRKAIDNEIGPNGKLEYSIVVDKGGKENNEPFTLKIRNSHTQSQRIFPIPLNTNDFKSAERNGRDTDNAKKKETPVAFENSIESPFQIPEVDPQYTESQLSPQYSFNTLIEGDCNRLARSAGLAIASKPGTTSFNPFVVYGGVGLGKTHLAQAIGNQIKMYMPEKFVLYVTTDQFTTQFIDALKNNNAQNFTNYYLKVDVLIIDDIQFLSGKEKTQENFFHIFNRLHQSGKQIIMTSDYPPKSMKGLQERLLSRFKWGLTADVQKPDLETRLAITQSKLQSEGVVIPDDVVEYLARNIDSNIRELEGVLISLIANASFMRKEIDLELAKNTLISIVRNTEKEITIEFIQQIVADYFKVSINELKSKTRKKDIAMARQIAMYFSQQYTSLPLKSIGNEFGGRDHSTVVHASKTVAKKSHADAIYSKVLDDLLDLMQVKKPE